MKNETMTELSDFIKKSRRRSKLSQIELAKRSGIGLRFIREIEQNKASTTKRIDKVNLLLNFFGHRLTLIKIQREN
jgi:transcriptional regulator with XRE-family HTH domain